MSGLMVAAMMMSVIPTGIALAAGSATLTLSPNDKQVQVGDRFDLSIQVSPNGEALDTVRANISFSSDLLKVEHVQLSNSFPRVTPGNYIDNTSGTLSQGGFTLEGPVNADGTLATITFLTKASGEATVAILDTSRAISAGEEKINAATLGSATVRIEEAIEEPLVPEGVALLRVASSTHIDQGNWYSNNNISFSWGTEGGEAITEFRTAFDQSPETDPAEVRGTETLERDYSGVEDGVWYFHIKGRQADGQFTNTVHYRTQVDTTVPNPIQPTTDEIQLAEGKSTFMRFATTDDTSGVMRYEISINEGPFTPADSPYELKDLAFGDYYLKAKAIDAAGNAIHGITTMRVYPKGVLEVDEEDKGLLDELLDEGGQGYAVIGGVILLIIILIILSKIKAKHKKSSLSSK